MVAAEGARIKLREIHIGTMGWSYNFWKTSFYPENLKPKEFLAYYAAQFNSVEVNSTFYRIPRKQSVMEWKEQTPDGFKFSLKFPRIITHIKMLKNCEEEAAAFIERVELLKEKLGPLLLQFPYAFTDDHALPLRDFLKDLPKQHRYVVEVRNRKLLNESFYSLLRDNHAALAWVDSPLMPEINEVTPDFIYVRWEGDRRKVKGTLGKTEMDRVASIKLWTKRISQLAHEETDVFGYFSKYYSGHPPSDVREFLRFAKATE